MAVDWHNCQQFHFGQQPVTTVSIAVTGIAYDRISRSTTNLHSTGSAHCTSKQSWHYPRYVVSKEFPAGTWRKNYVVLTSIWRDYVASTSIRRHFGTKGPLGILFRMFHICYLIESLFIFTVFDKKKSCIKLMIKQETAPPLGYLLKFHWFLQTLSPKPAFFTDLVADMPEVSIVQ